MLANGIKLAFSKTKGDYQNLVGLKEVPEFGIEPEKVENTTLADKVKKYEFGIGDAGELEYKFSYDNTTATSPYRVLRKAAEDKEKLYFEQTYPDNTKVTFEGQVSVKLGGGGVNSVIEFTLKIALQSELTFVDGIGG